MGQSVEVPGGAALPAHLALKVGDVARLGATGAVVQSGEQVVVITDISLRTSDHDQGTGPRPAGLPNTVHIEARQPGQAVLKLFTGASMLGQTPQTHLLTVTVEA